jgi:hypothetical protein
VIDHDLEQQGAHSDNSAQRCAATAAAASQHHQYYVERNSLLRVLKFISHAGQEDMHMQNRAL